MDLNQFPSPDNLQQFVIKNSGRIPQPRAGMKLLCHIFQCGCRYHKFFRKEKLFQHLCTPGPCAVHQQAEQDQKQNRECGYSGYSFRISVRSRKGRVLHLISHRITSQQDMLSAFPGEHSQKNHYFSKKQKFILQKARPYTYNIKYIYIQETWL